MTIRWGSHTPQVKAQDASSAPFHHPCPAPPPGIAASLLFPSAWLTLRVWCASNPDDCKIPTGTLFQGFGNPGGNSQQLHPSTGSSAETTVEISAGEGHMKSGRVSPRVTLTCNHITAWIGSITACPPLHTSSCLLTSHCSHTSLPTHLSLPHRRTSQSSVMSWPTPAPCSLGPPPCATLVEPARLPRYAEHSECSCLVSALGPTLRTCHTVCLFALCSTVTAPVTAQDLHHTQATLSFAVKLCAVQPPCFLVELCSNDAECIVFLGFYSALTLCCRGPIPSSAPSHSSCQPQKGGPPLPALTR